MVQNSPLSIIILSAGKGKRMNNPNISKVMALLDGKPLIHHVLEQSQKLTTEKIIIIVGHQKESVIEYVNSLSLNNTSFVEQKEQLGTGHAVAQAGEGLKDFSGDVLILSGDVPLIGTETLNYLIDNHVSSHADATVLSAITKDPKGYGRIVRNSEGDFIKIVEEKDSTDKEKDIKEINSGIYILNSSLLFDSLKKVSNTNAQKEYYLTDIIEILKSQNKNVQAFPGADFNEIQGVNSPDDLERVEKYYYKFRIIETN